MTSNENRIIALERQLAQVGQRCVICRYWVPQGNWTNGGCKVLGHNTKSDFGCIRCDLREPKP